MRNPCWNSVCLSVKCHFSTGFLHNIFLFQCFFATPSLRGWAPRAFCRENAANSAFLSCHNYIHCLICIQTESYSDRVFGRLLSTSHGWKCHHLIPLSEYHNFQKILLKVNGRSEGSNTRTVWTSEQHRAPLLCRSWFIPSPLLWRTMLEKELCLGCLWCHWAPTSHAHTIQMCPLKETARFP